MGWGVDKKKNTAKILATFQKGGNYIRMVHIDDVLAIKVQEAFQFKETARKAQKEYEDRRRIIEQTMKDEDLRAFSTDEFIVTRDTRITTRVDRSMLEQMYPEAFNNVTMIEETNVIKIIRK